MKFHVLIGLSHCSQISTAMWRCQYPTNAGQMTVGPKPRAARRKQPTFRSFEVRYIKTSGVLVIGPQTSKGAVIVLVRNPPPGRPNRWSSCIRCWDFLIELSRKTDPVFTEGTVLLDAGRVPIGLRNIFRETGSPEGLTQTGNPPSYNLGLSENHCFPFHSQFKALIFGQIPYSRLYIMISHKYIYI